MHLKKRLWVLNKLLHITFTPSCIYPYRCIQRKHLVVSLVVFVLCYPLRSVIHFGSHDAIQSSSLVLTAWRVPNWMPLSVVCSSISGHLVSGTSLHTWGVYLRLTSSESPVKSQLAFSENLHWLYPVRTFVLG